MKYSLTRQDDLGFLNLHWPSSCLHQRVRQGKARANVKKGIKMPKVFLQRVVLLTVAFCMASPAFGGAQESPLVVMGTISFIDEQAQQFGMKLTGAPTKSSNQVVNEVVFNGIPKILSDNQPIHPRDVLLGVEAILVLSNDGDDRPVLYVPPSGSNVVFLRASECLGLGGSVGNNSNCPLVDQPDGQRTRTACSIGCHWYSWSCNVVCIDEAG
jgi:hypothetical protein